MTAGLVGVTTLTMAVPAEAQRWAGRDPAGDVSGHTYSADPEPCGTVTDVDATANTANDITRLTARHAARMVRVDVRFRSLQPHGFHGTSLPLKADGTGYEVSIERRRSGKVAVHLFDLPDPPERGSEDDCGYVSIIQVVLSCPDLEGAFDTKADTVTVTLPRGCLGHPRWVRVGASSYAWGRTSYHDRWAPPGTRHHGWGPYGARLRAD